MSCRTLHLLSIGLLSFALSGLALAGGAAPAAAASAATADADALEQIQTRQADARPCVRDTGTRIKRGRTCQPGRSYDRDDIRHTGATDVADALRRLDPAVSIRRP